MSGCDEKVPSDEESKSFVDAPTLPVTPKKDPLNIDPLSTDPTTVPTNSDPLTAQFTDTLIPTKVMVTPEVKTVADDQVRSSVSKVRSRASKSLSTSLQLRVKTQLNRVKLLEELKVRTATPAMGLLVGEIGSWATQLEEIHTHFLLEHRRFEESWPDAHIDHPYFKDDTFSREATLAGELRQHFGRLRQLALGHSGLAASGESVSSSRPSHLPELEIGKFSGDYGKWTEFSETFKAIVLRDSSISDVVKLQYLRRSLTDAPAQLISRMPLTAESLRPSWNLLRERYENKRLIVQNHIDRILDASPRSECDAKPLSDMLSTVNESVAAIRSLGVSEEMWDCILVQHLSRGLDRKTREKWEAHQSQMSSVPRFDEFERFILSRVRVLEAVENASWSQSSVQPASRPPTHPSAHQSAHQSANRSAQQSAHQSARGSSTGTVKKAALAASLPPRPQPVDPLSRQFPCDCCGGEHFLVKCEKFRDLSGNARREVIVAKQLCFNCFGRHNARSCRSTHLCKTCNVIDTQEPLNVCSTLLATALAKISSPVATVTARLLIDPGSELTFVSENLIRLLKLNRKHSSFAIHGIGGERSAQTRGIVTITLQSLHSNTEITIGAHVLKTLTTVLPSFDASGVTWPHLTGLELADPDFCRPRAIDIIAGANIYGTLIKPNVIRGSTTTPMAQKSVFGWLVLGPVSLSHSSISTSLHATSRPEEQDLQTLLTRFWVQEEGYLDAPGQLTIEERECEEHFRTTHSRDASGRYVVRIPLMKPSSVLGDSYRTAHFCLQRTLRRLGRDETYSSLYHQFMKEYEDLGHMVRASSTHPDGVKCFYLPHHGVLRPERKTTKLRVVFNGSSSTSSGLSVNDIMHTGANLLLNITDVLMWIRQHRCLFATDITKMYRQILIHPEDQDLQRIMWIDEHQREVPFKLTTVTYGIKAAPFLAVRVLQQLAEDEGSRFPQAVQSINFGRYVDDIFGGADDIDQLIETAHQRKGLCNAGGFPLAKWCSTHQDLLTAVSASETQGSTISLDDCTTKLLGVTWIPKLDIFSFVINSEQRHGQLTKRVILSQVAQIFDPLGFCSPVVIRAKMLMQGLWLLDLKWDDSLPAHVATKWLVIRDDMKRLSSLKIPRWYGTISTSTVEIHGFSDASQLAMGAVVYITVSSPSSRSTTSYVCSKTKVAPLKRLTIPKLELTAALMLAKLVKNVQSALKLNATATHLWTDSLDTLSWVKAHASRWRDYVRNRVTQIQDLLPSALWHHVPGKDNPADCASRGITTEQLKDHSLWWTGPPWLTQGQEAWPCQSKASQHTTNLEARPGISLVVAAPRSEYHWDLIYGPPTLNGLLRRTALIMRAVRRFKRMPVDSPVSIFSSADLRDARIFWIKATQAAFFSSELSRLKESTSEKPVYVFNRLTAFIDGEGVMRAGGRLENAPLNYEEKHPAILPRESRLSELIIDNAHRVTLHGGTQLTLSYIRRTTWIIGGRAPVKAYIWRCVECTRQRGIRAHQLMGQLPLCRISPTRAFTHTGVDYAGPLTIKAWRGRGAKTHKGWICVFVCLTTSAVHVEAVSDCSTEGFIASYRRFVSRRGIPFSLYSDCGTNFRGAEVALRKLFLQSSREHHHIASVLSKDNTQWSFNPPASPHMGGKWEAAVKSIKFHLRRTVGETLLTFEELSTLLTQIEAVLNTRPLEPLSDDADDLSALTPAHFLVGGSLASVPEPSLTDISTAKLSRWQFIQQCFQSFWNRWSAHYLQQQLAHSKWQHVTDQIKIGSLVLLTNENFPPSKWPLARVIQTHPGKDGLTRVVTIKTATTTLTRPIVKLVPLPIPPPPE